MSMCLLHSSRLISGDTIIKALRLPAHMAFKESKARCMHALDESLAGEGDRSRAGRPDKQIISLITAINACDAYYTTSSCAGRIMLIEVTPDKKKHESIWLHVTHDHLNADDAVNALEHYSKTKEHEAWFKMEGIILHVCAATLQDAEKLLTFAQHCGLKHAGILSASRKGKEHIIVELIDTIRIEAPLAFGEYVVAHADYLVTLAKEANRRLDITRDRMRRLQDAVSALQKK